LRVGYSQRISAASPWGDKPHITVTGWCLKKLALDAASDCSLRRNLHRGDAHRPSRAHSNHPAPTRKPSGWYSRDAYAVAQDAGEARSRDRIRNEREVASSREIVPMSEFRRSPLRRDGQPGQVFRATETLLTNGCGEMCGSVVRITFETFALTICTPSIPRLMEQVATF
jgi:hypothetical protein